MTKEEALVCWRTIKKRMNESKNSYDFDELRTMLFLAMQALEALDPEAVPKAEKAQLEEWSKRQPAFHPSNREPSGSGGYSDGRSGYQKPIRDIYADRRGRRNY